MRLLLLVILLSSCSAQWHLKQAIKKDSSLLKPNKVLIDTLIVTDSFISVDTFTLNEIDSFISDTGKVRVTIYKIKNRYTLKTEIKHDSIRIKKEIECPPSVIQVNENCWKKCLYSFLTGGLLATIILIIYYAKKMDNTEPNKS